MSTQVLTIEDVNVSRLWAKALIAASQPGIEALAPLVVTADLRGGAADEDAQIRAAADNFLSRYPKMRTCATTAGTIFPASLWNPDLDRRVLFERYLRALPRIRKQPLNGNGVYFQRMVQYGEKQTNQLKHVLDTWDKGNHRASALQLCIFDPARDHTDQRMRGFPCLQQVNFIPQSGGGLQVVGVYATQYLVDRAYGNYLGLLRLGQFVAHEMGLKLTRLTCIAPKAEIGNVAKGDVQRFAAQLELMLAPTIPSGK